MQKKILAAVDDSTPSRQAVEYAGRMGGVVQGLGVTLFHVQPPISQFLLDEAKRSGRAQTELNKITARNAEASRGLLAGYRETLIRAGLAESAIELATQPRNKGLAKDILDCAQNGLFDAILVGRRGISAVQQMFMGSVSAHLIENSPVIPVWLVDGNQVEPNIHAGIKYMRWMIDHYYGDEPMTQLDKALVSASYNAGAGRISQLRKEAAQRGLNPNIWFHNVEYIAAEKIGAETVTYVSNIYKYYIAYKLLTEVRAEKDLATKQMGDKKP